MSELIDNRAHRIRTMKEIIKHLHGGGSPEVVRTRLREFLLPSGASGLRQGLLTEVNPDPPCSLFPRRGSLLCDPPRPPR